MQKNLKFRLGKGCVASVTQPFSFSAASSRAPQWPSLEVMSIGVTVKNDSDFFDSNKVYKKDPYTESIQEIRLYMKDYKGGDFFINGQANQPIQITPESRALIVGGDQEYYEEPISLTVNTGINVGTKGVSQIIKPSTNSSDTDDNSVNKNIVFDVGNTGYKTLVGHVSIGGDLNFYGLSSDERMGLIGVNGYSETKGEYNSSLTVKGSINVEDVDLGGILLRIRGNIDTQGINIVNTSAGKVIDIENSTDSANVRLGKVNIVGGAENQIGSILTVDDSRIAELDSLTVLGSDISDKLVIAKDDNYAIDLQGQTTIQNGIVLRNLNSGFAELLRIGESADTPRHVIGGIEISHIDTKVDNYVIETHTFYNGSSDLDLLNNDITIHHINYTNTASDSVDYSVVELEKTINNLKDLTVTDVVATLEQSPGVISAVRFENMADNFVANNVRIKNINGGQNSTYGLYIGDRLWDAERKTQINSLSVSGIKAQTNAKGFYHIASDGEHLSKDSIKSLFVSDIQASDADGVMTAAEVFGKSSLAVTENASLYTENAWNSTYAGAYGADAPTQVFNVNRIALMGRNGGSVDFTQGQYALQGAVVAYGSDTDPAKASSVDLAGNLTLLGDVYAANAGQVNVTLESGSVFEGQVDDYSSNTLNMVRQANLMAGTSRGTTNLTIDEQGQATLTMNGGDWIARGRNIMTNLSFTGNGGTVDLSKTRNGSLTVANLSGNGSYKMGFAPYAKDTDTVANGNMLYVTESFDTNSTQNIEIVAHDGLSSIEDLDGMRFATTVGDAGDAKSFKVSMKDQGFFNRDFEIKTEKYDAADDKNAVFNGEGRGEGTYKPGEDTVNDMFDGKDATNWYIDVANQVTPPDPENPDNPGTGVSDAGKTIMATLRGTYWTAISMDRLNQRLGDARYANGTDGLWLRVRHDQFGTDTGMGDFKSKGQTYQLGFDHAFQKENGRLLTGLAFDYMDAEVDYRGIHGEGSTERFAATAYVTWLADDGYYVDATAKYGVLSNSFNITNASGSVVDADYDDHVLGASLEAGRKLTNTNGMFLEPQLQMQYTHVTSAHFGTSQGTSVSQDGIDSFVTRMGVRVGCLLGEDQRSNIYWKADVLKEWAGKQTVKVRDVTTTADGVKFSVENDNVWFDIGAGFQYHIAKDIHAYADVEYRYGNEIDKSWTINGGARWQF